MSKRNRNPEPAPQPKEKTMPSATDTSVLPIEDLKVVTAEEPTGPTAKEMAAAEEANALRARAIIDRQQAQMAAEAERPTLIEVAAQGMDALHEAIRTASSQPVPEYTPPPRTERQMTALEQELEAGRRAGERARAQDALAKEARARQAAEEASKEGFTTPVYRPNDMVPDPMTGKPGPISS